MLSTRSCLGAGLLVLSVSLIVTTAAAGAIDIDVTTSTDHGSAKNTISPSAFATSSGNELPLAFVSADRTASHNPRLTQVAGGGLSRVLVKRANGQMGTAEIWRALAPSALSGVTAGVPFWRQHGSHWSIQGNISPSSSGTGAIVTLTQGSTTIATTTVGAAGSYAFNGVVNGTYTVTPSNTGYVFAPSSQTVTVNGASITGVNFTASLPPGSIQGYISPTSSGTGATVTLTQGSTTIAATTMDSNGNYSMNGVVNGTYSVTPTKSGYAFTPLSQSVTVNGAPITSINFTASALPTYSISGMISPSANGSGATVTLSGTASATTTADPSGAFSFSGLVNGSYTVAATKAGFAISPASQPVSVNNALVTGVNFTAAVGLGIDVVTYSDSNSPSTAAITSTFSTNASNELLLAFISADSSASPNTTVTQVAGGGLTWVLVQRANVQLGTAEIWRAFAPAALSGITVTATLSQKVDSSITVMSFAGVNTSGANGSGAIGAVGSGNADPGAPTATLVTTANGSLVLGVGNDWDLATARTLGPNQAMIHQFLANVGDTYWVQRESNPTPLSGTSVTLNDSGPTSDRYNLTIVEVLPAPAGTVGTSGTYGIFGTLSPSAQGSGATITLSGTASGTITADGSGNYGFTGLSSGSYTVTPSKSGYSFSPAAQSATINGANVAVNFTVSSSPPPVAVSISPTSAALSTGGQQQFTAYVSGTSNTAVTWSATGGTVTSSGLYTAPGTAGTYPVTATSAADTTKSASASVTVSQASQISVSVSPTAVSINQGAQQQFAATVAGTSNTGVNWSVISGSGTISSSGLFTAPNKQESDTVQAQSQADTTKTASASVTVPAVSLSLSPLSATVQPSGTQQFTATVSGTTNTGVLWSEIGNGAVTQSGLYTAPVGNETDTVTATAVASSAATKSASVTVAAQSQTGCGASLNWTSSVCQQINGTLKPQWTVVSRHGEYGQQETESNVPWEVTAGSGSLGIKTETVADSTGDFNVDGTVKDTPQSWPFSTGDIQMNTFHFRFGTIVINAAYPPQSSQTWPSHWMLTSKCQDANKYSGDPGQGGCPQFGTAGYNEIDPIECFKNTWCQFNVFSPNEISACQFDYAVDTLTHTFMTIWTAASLTQYVDGVRVGGCNQAVNDDMFLLIQTQTGSWTQNNSSLPSTFTTNYVKICNTTDGTCPTVPSTDPSVIFYDNFGAN